MVRRVNILLLPRHVVEYSMQSLFISPESYSGISVMVLPLSVHAEYPCAPLGSLMRGYISPSKKSQENAIFLAHLQIFHYLCNRKSEKSALQTYFIKAFALFEDSFKLGHFEITLLRIMRNAHVYTWAFLHILECYGSPSPKEPIAVAHVFLCAYVKTNKTILTN